MIGEIINKLIEDESIKDVHIYSKDAEFFTHMIVVVDHNDVKKKILYDKNNNSIFKEIGTCEILNKKNKKQKLIKINVTDIQEIHKDVLIRLINGALKNCIDNHGDITRNYIGSASKRITTNIFNYLQNTKYKIKKEDNKVSKKDD